MSRVEGTPNHAQGPSSAQAPTHAQLPEHAKHAKGPEHAQGPEHTHGPEHAEVPTHAHVHDAHEKGLDSELAGAVAVPVVETGISKASDHTAAAKQLGELKHSMGPAKGAAADRGVADFQIAQLPPAQQLDAFPRLQLKPLGQFIANDPVAGVKVVGALDSGLAGLRFDLQPAPKRKDFTNLLTSVRPMTLEEYVNAKNPAAGFTPAISAKNPGYTIASATPQDDRGTRPAGSRFDRARPRDAIGLPSPQGQAVDGPVKPIPGAPKTDGIKIATWTGAKGNDAAPVEHTDPKGVHDPAGATHARAHGAADPSAPEPANREFQVPQAAVKEMEAYFKKSGPVDPSLFVQWVLRESYLETTADLMDYAKKVQFFNAEKKQIREQLDQVRGALSKVTGDDEDAAIDPPLTLTPINNKYTGSTNAGAQGATGATGAAGPRTGSTQTPPNAADAAQIANAPQMSQEQLRTFLQTLIGPDGIVDPKQKKFLDDFVAALTPQQLQALQADPPTTLGVPQFVAGGVPTGAVPLTFFGDLAAAIAKRVPSGAGTTGTGGTNIQPASTEFVAFAPPAKDNEASDLEKLLLRDEGAKGRLLADLPNMTPEQAANILKALVGGDGVVDSKLKDLLKDVVKAMTPEQVLAFNSDSASAKYRGGDLGNLWPDRVAQARTEARLITNLPASSSDQQFLDALATIPAGQRPTLKSTPAEANTVEKRGSGGNDELTNESGGERIDTTASELKSKLLGDIPKKGPARDALIATLKQKGLSGSWDAVADGGRPNNAGFTFRPMREGESLEKYIDAAVSEMADQMKGWYRTKGDDIEVDGFGFKLTLPAYTAVEKTGPAPGTPGTPPSGVGGATGRGTSTGATGDGGGIGTSGAGDNGAPDGAGTTLSTKKELEAAQKSLEEKLNSAGDDAQLANVDMQNWLQKQQQTLQMMSNISKNCHDTAMAIIRQMAG